MPTVTLYYGVHISSVPTSLLAVDATRVVAVVVVLEWVKMYVLAGRTVGPEVVIVIVGGLCGSDGEVVWAGVGVGVGGVIKCKTVKTQNGRSEKKC